MSDTVIQVEGLSKRYRLGRSGTHADLRESVSHWLGRLSPRNWRKPGDMQDKHGADGVSESTKGESEKAFWALRDVNFTVPRGQVLGIIGRNGAGKSTLLKILSRITSPTHGQITIDGRVGSLLEVGTGFHPELTGRENIFLNGAVLGMSQREVKRKFDAIVDFAGVEKFLDTPVKRYSSGMYVRLAFAVAAHLEPEVLIVDEVLAVGDAAFQARCLGRMREVAGNGRTVLFVSHNMRAVLSLCQRAIVLQAGRVLCDGLADDCVKAYLGTDTGESDYGQLAEKVAQLPLHPAFQLHKVDVYQHDRPTLLVGNGQPVTVEVEYEVRQPLTGLRVYFDVCDEWGDILIRSFHDEHQAQVPVTLPGRYRSQATIPANLLAPRAYALTVRGSLHEGGTLTGPGVSFELHVQPTSGVDRAYAGGRTISKLQPLIDWQTTGAAA